MNNLTHPWYQSQSHPTTSALLRAPQPVSKAEPGHTKDHFSRLDPGSGLHDPTLMTTGESRNKHRQVNPELCVLFFTKTDRTTALLLKMKP